MMTTREALEAALVATPDDTPLHAAYADLLIEDGDPRGEYIRLCLLAEDRNQPLGHLRAIEQAAFELRSRHEAEWLGPLWEFVERRHVETVDDMVRRTVQVSWRRGWIDAIRIGQLTDELVTAIAECPVSKVLGELSIERNVVPGRGGGSTTEGEIVYSEENMHRLVDMTPLVQAGRFRALRVFKHGSFVDGIVASGWDLDEYLADAPRLEEFRVCCDQFSSAFLFGGEFPRLHTIHVTGNICRVPFALLGYNDKLPNLRTLFIDTESLRVPADSPGGDRRELSESDFLCLHRPTCLPALEYFTLRDSSVGDEGLRLILEAPFFGRLKGLDLSRCGITDDGAELLARHPHSPRLEYLRLDGNYLSPIGIEALDAIGVTVGEQAFGMPLANDEF